MQAMRELLERIRKAPGMYLGEPSLTKLASFLHGYQHGLYEHDPANHDTFLSEFRDWVLQRYAPGSSRGWEYVIRTRANSDDEAAAFDLFWTFFDDFLKEQERTAAATETNGATTPAKTTATASLS